MRQLKGFMLLVLALAASATVPGSGPEFNPGVDRTLSDIVISESGYVTLSADGLGMIGSSGLIQVEKPSAGATVRSAYLAAASTGFSGYVIGNGCVSLNGSGVSWDLVIPNGIASYNHWANVTALVAGTINAAGAGIVNLSVDECDTGNIDGEALYVIFDDPSSSIYRTAVIAFGAQSTTGDTFFIGFGSPVDVQPSTVIAMGLAISFGYQGMTCQTSYVDVNGSRLTSSAGGNDEGEDFNGALITVGGVGDSQLNPADPNYQDPCTFDANFTFYDDELYDIAGYVSDGDVGMTAATFNPSNDDNIFAAHLLLDFAAVVGEGAVLTPADAVNCLGDPHTVTVTLQDDNGNPVSGRDVIINVVAGPNSGNSSGLLVTNGSGQASYTYTGYSPGLDILVASFINAQGVLENSNYAFKYWTRCVVGADEQPEAFTLAQNSPNPFNPSTTISFNMPETGPASLLVYSLGGELVKSMDLGLAPRGANQVQFDGSTLASGVYIYTLRTEVGSLSGKMLLIK